MLKREIIWYITLGLDMCIENFYGMAILAKQLI